MTPVRAPKLPLIPFYCQDCGSRLIRQHYRYHRAEEGTHAAVDLDDAGGVRTVDVVPYCIYDKVHEAEKRGRRR